MKHNLPSVKTLMKLTERYTGSVNGPLIDCTPKHRARVIRRILENPDMRRCEKIDAASNILNLHGYENIPHGKGKRSPEIEYVNSGDAYKPTLMYVHGRGFRVGCWADIVERGRYE